MPGWRIRRGWSARLLDSDILHPAHKARTHLRIRTAAIGVPDSRGPTRVLALVGTVRCGQSQDRRLLPGYEAAAGAWRPALLGDPRGADPGRTGLRGWIPRGWPGCGACCARSRRRGRTVLVSSHRLTESAQFVDRVVILSKGRPGVRGGAS